MTAPRHGEASDDSDVREDTDHIASALSQRCSSLARRILSGAGMATMVAHTMISAGESPEKWTCDLQAHGVTASGRFVVAQRSHPAQALCQVPAGLPTDVRLEISKDAPEPAIRLLAATLHVLGTITWLDPRPSRPPVGHGRATKRGIDHRWIRRRPHRGRRPVSRDPS